MRNVANHARIVQQAGEGTIETSLRLVLSWRPCNSLMDIRQLLAGPLRTNSRLKRQHIVRPVAGVCLLIRDLLPPA